MSTCEIIKERNIPPQQFNPQAPLMIFINSSSLFSMSGQGTAKLIVDPSDAVSILTCSRF